MHRHADDHHHDHPHTHDAEPVANPPKSSERSSSRDRESLQIKLKSSQHHLHLDPFSGIAGDMMLGALLDLKDDPHAELEEIQKTLRSLDLDDPFELSIQRVQRCGVGGLDLKVKTPHHHAHGEHDHHHPHVGYTEIMAMVTQLTEAGHLSPRGTQRATAVVTQLADAEARVHGTTREAIHFHEVGAVDSIVDMLGSVLALERLNINTLTAGPIPLSRGYVKCDHGLMPVPAPATAYLIQGMPTVGVDRTGELITPTGAALLAGLVDAFAPAPNMTITGVGYGAGDRDDPAVPNLLRVFVGQPITTKHAAPPPMPVTTLV